MTTTDKLAPGVTRVDLGDGRVALIRKAKVKHIRAFQELLADKSMNQDDLGVLIARWALVGLEGVKNDDGEDVNFSTENDDCLGVIATSEAVDELYVSEIEAIGGAAANLNTVSKVEAGN